MELALQSTTAVPWRPAFPILAATVAVAVAVALPVEGETAAAGGHSCASLAARQHLYHTQPASSAAVSGNRTRMSRSLPATKSDIEALRVEADRTCPRSATYKPRSLAYSGSGSDEDESLPPRVILRLCVWDNNNNNYTHTQPFTETTQHTVKFWWINGDPPWPLPQSCRQANSDFSTTRQHYPGLHPPFAMRTIQRCNIPKMLLRSNCCWHLKLPADNWLLLRGGPLTAANSTPPNPPVPATTEAQHATCQTASRTRYDSLYRYGARWAYQPVCM